MKISFIIPCLNEEKYIGTLIKSIKKESSNIHQYEIIVVDNGSNDSTAAIAGEMGARVFIKPRLAIGALRNYGVQKSLGQIIVFLDADLYLEDDWWKELSNILDHIELHHKTIFGSLYRIRENAGWLERAWFDPTVRRTLPNYINGGHIVLQKEIFEKIGGFNEQLLTGEDVEFCSRAREKGARIVHFPSLKVVHLGFPKDIRSFFKRERWHGIGDCQSIKSIFSSKITIISIAQLMLFVVCTFFSIVIGHLWPLLSYFVITFTISIYAATRKYRLNVSTFFINSFVYYVYFTARSLSFIDHIFKLKRSR